MADGAVMPVVSALRYEAALQEIGRLQLELVETRAARASAQADATRIPFDFAPRFPVENDGGFVAWAVSDEWARTLQDWIDAPELRPDTLNVECGFCGFTHAKAATCRDGKRRYDRTHTL